jgi:hypothetical protein
VVGETEDFVTEIMIMECFVLVHLTYYPDTGSLLVMSSFFIIKQMVVSFTPEWHPAAAQLIPPAYSTPLLFL